MCATHLSTHTVQSPLSHGRRPNALEKLEFPTGQLGWFCTNRFCASDLDRRADKACKSKTLPAHYRLVRCWRCMHVCTHVLYGHTICMHIYIYVSVSRYARMHVSRTFLLLLPVSALHVIVAIAMLLRAMFPQNIQRMCPLTTFLASTDSSIACDCIYLDAAPCHDAQNIKRTRPLTTLTASTDGRIMRAMRINDVERL